jgi:sulfatase modifying factor 1
MLRPLPANKKLGTVAQRNPNSARYVLLLALGVGLSGIVVAAVLKAPRRTTPTMPGHSRSSASAAPVVSSPPSASVAPAPARPPLLDENPDTISAQREVLFKNMQAQLELSDEVIAKTRAIFAEAKWTGQGNPKITKHPMTRQECLAIREKQSVHPADARCGGPNMVAVFDPAAGQNVDAAKLCIDQYEYPNIACDYPVTWVKSDQAQNLCKAQGKRLCDAHEWEGACAGALHTPEQDYTFGERRLQQEYLHNKDRQIVWAYGPKKNHALCATGSSKSPKCNTPSWEQCGSNTYPAGAFPECVSSFGVYDQHGNAAEHMNLPLVAEELGSRGGTGENEMKGSWFIFQQTDAHEDDCRWRARAWHAGKLMAKDAHFNYHLGFRCCKDL